MDRPGERLGVRRAVRLLGLVQAKDEKSRAMEREGETLEPKKNARELPMTEIRE